ncbi:hypothetical protein H4582DRAFT_2069715 [Lactarius indigo]|nr:hypothetical protein H4582DRAFT_2069715 [Lactarius indigo]
MRSSPHRSLQGNKDVNVLLHTLRGEHFRRALNSQRHPRGSPVANASHIDTKVTPTPVAGPIPRSWAVTTAPAKAFESPEWRETALSLFFAPIGGSSGPMGVDARSAVPRLGDFCLRVILRYCGTDADVLKDLVPYLGPHLRKQLMRICAVRCPLPSASLRVLLGEEHNQVDGELLVVEPTSPPRPELFQSEQSQAQKDPEGLWDAETHDAPGPQPLTALAIVSAALLTPTLLAFPPSVTRLALVHLSAPVLLHRLPDKCPLLEMLDISYNPWLGEPAWGGERVLEKVAWQRWAYLKVLGCRECGIELEELRRVNEGRWDDVTIVT